MMFLVDILFHGQRIAIIIIFYFHTFFFSSNAGDNWNGIMKDTLRDSCDDEVRISYLQDNTNSPTNLFNFIRNFSYTFFFSFNFSG